MDSFSELERFLSELEKEENQILSDLKEMLDDKKSNISYNLSLLADKVMVNENESEVLTMQSISHTAAGICSSLTENAQSSDSIAEKLKQINLVQHRVAECERRVSDLIDLGRCSDGVTQALTTNDFEQAAAHIHRFLSMDQNQLKSTASDINNTNDLLLHPASLRKDGNNQKSRRRQLKSESSTDLDIALEIMHEATHKVRKEVQEHLEAAIKASDKAKIERFFKLFPLLNLDQEGLKLFTSGFLCKQLEKEGRPLLDIARNLPQSDKMYKIIFADTLTSFFDIIGRLVECYQPTIETYYGHGRMEQFLAMLQVELDIHVSTLFRVFNSKRKVDDLCKGVRKWLRNLESEDMDHDVDEHCSNPAEKEALTALLDIKNIELLINEMSMVLSNNQIYLSFITKRIQDDFNTAGRESSKQSVLAFNPKKTALSVYTLEVLSNYILLEEYYMTVNFNKAFNDDENAYETIDTSALSPSSDEPYESHLMDDIFFILKKSITRAFSTSSVDAVCAVLNNSTRFLDTDLAKGVLGGRSSKGCGNSADMSKTASAMTSVLWNTVAHYRGSTTSGNTHLGGASGQSLSTNLSSSSTPMTSNAPMSPNNAASSINSVVESAIRKQIMQFMMNLRNIEVGIEYVSRLRQTIQPYADTFLTSPTTSVDDSGCQMELEQRVERVKESLNSFADVDTALNGVFDEAIARLIDDLAVPNFKTSCFPKSPPSLLTPSSVNTEDDFTRFDSSTFVRSVVTVIDYLQEVSNLTSDTSRKKLVEASAREFVRQWEKVIFSTTYSRWGAIALEQQIRSVSTYVGQLFVASSNETGGQSRWSSNRNVRREIFGRLLHITSILNVENLSEMVELWNSNSKCEEKDDIDGQVGPSKQERVLASSSSSVSMFKTCWGMKRSEVKQVLNLRKDFNSVEIKRLKFV